MINWTFSRFPESPPLRTTQLLERFFSIAEIEENQKYKIPKRQSEWLASRLLAKRLVQKIIASDSPLPLKSITIQKESSGVPFVVVEGMGRVGWLSISHTRGGVLAAFSQINSIRFGVDIEFIDPRPLEIFADYFTVAEIAWLSPLNEQEKDVCSNLVWSAKEAFLKAIEKGLQMDTRKINIHPPDVCSQSKGWNAIDFSVEGNRLLDWQLLFSLNHDYMMTICLPAVQKSQLIELELTSAFD